MGLDKQVAIVTGAAQGIGAGIAQRLAAAGATVAVTDVRLAAVEATAQRLAELGANVAAFESDVTDTQQAQRTVDQVLNRFGRVDILVNNAGITRDGLLLRMSEQDWDAVIAVNLKGVFNFTKAVARTMLKQKGGCIVNVASIVGLRGNAGQVNYAASKAGVIAATKSLAKELAPRNIRVNAVAPGYIQTAMTEALDDKTREGLLAMIPAGRLGMPEDVAGAVLFLVSPEAGYITGEVLRIDGGLAM
jgi:3-oxoacyl-[acyl-carrier protein] reductase